MIFDIAKQNDARSENDLDKIEKAFLIYHK